MVWAKRMGGAGWDWTYAVSTDQSGNVYTTGGFWALADFDPGVNVSNLTPSGANDVFLSKLDSDGNFIWVKKIGGTGGDWGSAVSIDQNNNIYLAGGFTGTVDFDPGAGVTNLVASGGSDFFISKLDSVGNFVWAKKMGGATDEWGNGPIEIDSEGNVYTTGSFYGTVDFDPGAGVTNLTSAGNIDFFISKLDSLGNFVWAKRIGGTGADWASLKINLDDEIYLSGAFYSTVDFDPGIDLFNLVSAGNSDIFICKLDLAGNFVWAKKIGGSGDDWANYIVFDSSSNIFMAGAFASTVDFDSGSNATNLVSSGSNDAFIMKLGSDIFNPTVTDFIIPTFSTSLTVPITTFSASDNVGVSNYLITESDTMPLEGDIGWSVSIPTEYVFTTEGSKILYAWAKDEEGNISSSLTDTTLVDLNNPVINLIGKETLNVYLKRDYVDKGATASDATDGDISEDIIVVNNVDTKNRGVYTVTYNVSDSAGNQATEVVRTIRVINQPTGSTATPFKVNLPQTEPVVISPTPLKETIISDPLSLSFPKLIITKLLKLKTINSEVKDLQIYLNTHGYPVSVSGAGSPGKETTYFGEKTKSAVILFQKKNSLVADGIVGPKTSLLMK